MILSSGVDVWAEGVRAELKKKLPGQRKTQRDKLGLPVAWRVEETEGAIGFATQKTLLDAAAPRLPPDAKVILMADRFYGTPDLIGWCKNQGWDYPHRPRR